MYQTQDVNSLESLDRRLGSADARVTVQQGVSRVIQAPDPDRASASDGDARSQPLTARQVAAALGGARLVEQRTGGVRVVTRKGEDDIEAVEVDLRDPATQGLFRLTSGRLPSAGDEVVVNEALTAKGYAVGDVLRTPSDEVPDPTIVGIAESATTRDQPIAVGPLGSLAVATPGSSAWLVDGGPVSWAQVRALNAQGATVLSRAVVADPPPVPPQLQGYADATSAPRIAVVVLVIVMALIEVVLLAGPAFAVGARRQSRSLALMAATGGTPRQARRVVRAGGIVLGGVAALLGSVLGIGAAWLLLPLVQRFSNTWFGPFDVPWPHLLGIAAFGLVSALLAAVVPAWIASRQDVVAVLAGRRGDRRPSPVAGVRRGAARARRRRRGVRRGPVDQRRVLHRRLRHPLGARHDPAGPGGAGARCAALDPAAAHAPVRRARCRPAPLPHRPGGRRGRRHGRRGGRPRHRHLQRRRAERGESSPLAPGVGLVRDCGAWPSRFAGSRATFPTRRSARCAACRALGPLRRHVTACPTATAARQVRPTLGSYVLVSDDGLPVGVLGVADSDRAGAERRAVRGGIVAFTDRGVPGDGVRIGSGCYHGREVPGSTRPGRRTGGGRPRRLGSRPAAAVVSTRATPVRLRTTVGRWL